MTQSTEEKRVVPATKVDLAMFLQSTGVIKASEVILMELLAELEAPAQRAVGPDLALFFGINPAVRRTFVNRLVVALLSGPLTEAGIECPEITGIQPSKKSAEKVGSATVTQKKRRVV
jgi:hypothetical protein